MNKYTAEQVAREADLQEDHVADMLRDYATLLRERESAKAGVTDEMVERACEAFEGPHHWEFQTDLVKTNTRAAMRRSLSAVAPMLASARVADGLKPVAWVFPMRYGSGVQFPLPVKPDNWDDEDGEWYCRPLFYAAPISSDAIVPDMLQISENDPPTIVHYKYGWNDLRDAVLCAAPKPETEE